MTLENFNDILGKIRESKICGLTLNLKNIGIPELFTPFLPKLCKSFALYLDNCALPHKCLQNLSQYFMLMGEDYIKHLRKLNISMANNGLESYLLCTFVQSIKQLKNISSLDLNISDNFMDIKVLDSLT